MGVLRVWRGIAAAAVAALLFTGTAGAQGGQQAQGEVFTLAPGASATVRFEGFCAQYGEPFPEAVQAPSGLTDENIRAALALARAQGLTGSDQDALQVQYAIWQLQGETDAPQGGDLTRDVLNRSRTAQAPAPAGATSLIDAAGAGQVRVEVTEFAPVGAPVEISPGVTDNFYGRGALAVTNISGQELTLYMPVGTVLPSAVPEEQDLVAYSTSVEGDPAQAAAQATAAPTSAPTSAPTAAPTSAPTSAPTTAPTSAPTTAPTNVQAAGPTALPTVQAVASQPNELPNTSGGPPILPLALVALALGTALLRRAVRR